MKANTNNKLSNFLDIEIVTHISPFCVWLNWYTWKYIKVQLLLIIIIYF